MLAWMKILYNLANPSLHIFLNYCKGTRKATTIHQCKLVDL